MENINNQKYTLALLIKIIYLIDFKDKYIKNHSQNVAKYALLLGNQLGLSRKELEIIGIGCMLHDIGKIGISDYLLIKNDKLTDNEYEIMKRHSAIGEALLPSSGFEEVKKMIRSHHERMDGTGYPDGLKGSSIPYFARILSIADTFDAMTTQRTYNKLKTLDEAFAELISVSKKHLNYSNEIVQQLDPYLVDAFIQTVKNDSYLMEEFRKKDLDILKNRNKVKYK